MTGIMSTIKKVNDKLNHRDLLSSEMNRKPYARTKIVGGYDAYKDANGITRFGEVVFETENMIVLGGSLFTLEKVFGVQSPLTVNYLNDSMGIATGGSSVTEVYPKDTVVCLFGVGIGGSGESMTDVKPVNYHENEITEMIPLRLTADELTSEEQEKYWFKTNTEFEGKTAYYLKTFEATPEIKVLWKDGEGDEDGSEVNDIDSSATYSTPIETFIELTLKISKKDIREYFEHTGNVDQTRINSIGLFTGIKSLVDDNEYDYKQVKLFSKLNINNEMLTLSKDLTIVYRIYTS